MAAGRIGTARRQRCQGRFLRLVFSPKIQRPSSHFMIKQKRKGNMNLSSASSKKAPRGNMNQSPPQLVGLRLISFNRPSASLLRPASRLYRRYNCFLPFPSSSYALYLALCPNDVFLVSLGFDIGSQVACSCAGGVRDV